MLLTSCTRSYMLAVCIKHSAYTVHVYCSSCTSTILVCERVFLNACGAHLESDLTHIRSA